MLDFENNLGNAYKSDLFQEADHNAKIFFVNNVLSDMNSVFTSRQLNELNIVLQSVIKNYSISTDVELHDDTPYWEVNNNLLDRFIEDKRTFGLSEKTLIYYQSELIRFFDWQEKRVDEISTDDIRLYFEYFREIRKCSETTVDNIRRIFNSFYNYCIVNGLLYKNPCKKIDRIKGTKEIRKPFSTVEIIKLREQIDNLRDDAIFELLLSSGMRVGELTNLKKQDLNFEEKTVIVTGKGDKQRECFFNDLAKVKIQRYLETRIDDNPYLFVSFNRPFHQLGISGVETRLRDLGEQAGVNKVHPHRFRRTFATRLLHKGVAIDQIQKFLGHVNIETTKLYAMSDNDEIEYNIKRYVN